MVSSTTRTVLCTEWANGCGAAALLQAHAEPAGSLSTHVVALVETLPVAPVPAQAAPWATRLNAELAHVCEVGLHTVVVEPGRLQLTLVVGSFARSLSELRLQAECIVLPDASWAARAGALATAKALTRCARRGARLQCHAGASTQELSALLRDTGWAEGPPDQWTWSPPWTVKTTREPWRAWARPAGTCAVVGAGIAGAAVAAALARRGWQVVVLDAAAAPAAGASGLPVGLAAPYATADDSPLARLTRSGVRHLLQYAQQFLVPGQDWHHSGAHEFDLEGVSQWQAQACWVKPAALARAWLATPGVRFCGAADVAALRPGRIAWDVCDAAGAVLASADRVVLANAAGVTALLQNSSALREAGAGRGWPATHAVRGLVSWGRHDREELRPFPAVPVHGHGSLIAHVPFDDGARWFVGASYQPVSAREAEWPDDKNHGANALRLEKLAPDVFAALAGELEAGALKAWKGQRFVTADRLPLLGPVAPTVPDVWTCAGFGSRGLSLVAVCAELLAAQWAFEPWPVEASLAQAMIPYRKCL